MKQLLMADVGRLEIQDKDVPSAGKGQAVIKVIYGGICGSDVHVLNGEHPQAKAPLVLGHEFCGTLYDIDLECRDDLALGDLVSGHAVISCGKCAYCVNGRENICKDVKIFSVHTDGAFAQYVVVNAKRIVRFEKDIDPRIAVLVEPLAVAVHDVALSGLQPGDDVFIAGAGPIGILLGIMARHNGAGKVTLTDVNPIRVEIARSFGFSAQIAEEKDTVGKCLEIVHGVGYDRVFEAAAKQDAFDACFRLVKAGGVVVQVGMGRSRSDLDLNKIIYQEVTLRGVRNHPFQHFMQSAKLINDRGLEQDLKKVVSRVYPLEEAGVAFQAAAEDSSALKVLIDFRN